MAILSPAGVEERGTLLRELESTLLIQRCYSQDAPSLRKIGSQEYILLTALKQGFEEQF